MKLVYDENMPAVAELLGNQFETVSVNGRKLEAGQLEDASALLVRSVTPVDARLLAGSRVSFVGSATSGTDHVDQRWLDEQGIQFCHAPGANANSVVEYVLSAIASCDDYLERLLTGSRVGIVGYGHVGSALSRRLDALGIDWCCSDPWLSAEELQSNATLDDVLGCEVVCLHPELTHERPWPSYHLLGQSELGRLGRRQLLINASRGPIVDGQALLQRLLAPEPPDVVLDVWEHEPVIAARLLECVRFGTAHVAGYSLDSKIAATGALVQKLLQHFDMEQHDSKNLSGDEETRLQLAAVGTNAARLRQLLGQRYSISQDDALLRHVVLEGESPETGFDQLRKQYRERRELAGSTVRFRKADVQGEILLRALGCVPVSVEC